MASIFKRGKNYFINIVVDGMRIKKKIGPSKKIAELALKDYEVKVARQEFDFTIADISLNDLFMKFIEYSETNHAFSTTKRYKNVIMNLKIFLEIYFKNAKRISHLNAQIIEKYKHFRITTDPRTINLPKNFPYIIKNNSLKAKTKTLNYEIKTLRSIFQYGVRNKLCKENPCESVTSMKVTDASTPRFLTFEESELFLNSCGDFHPIFYTFLNTGLRLGELLHLQWNDIDFKRKK